MVKRRYVSGDIVSVEEFTLAFPIQGTNEAVSFGISDNELVMILSIHDDNDSWMIGFVRNMCVEINVGRIKGLYSAQYAPVAQSVRSNRL